MRIRHLALSLVVLALIFPESQAVAQRGGGRGGGGGGGQRGGGGGATRWRRWRCPTRWWRQCPKRWRAGSAVAVREVVGADSVADSHLESRRGTRNAAMPTWGRSVAALAEVALGRVQAPEARDERVAALAAQVGQVLERAARDAKQSELVMQEDRVQSPVVQVSGRQILAA